MLANVGFLSSISEHCITCDAGTFCPVGSASQTQCLPGTIAPVASMQTCDLCANGKFQRLYGATACETCTPGFYCKGTRARARTAD